MRVYLNVYAKRMNTMSDSFDRPHIDIEPDFEKIDRWYFFPYTNAPGFTPDTPLYSVVVVYEDIGDVMVYSRPGEGGCFHSLEPGHEDDEPTPPTDAFQTAITKVLTNPDKDHDLTGLVGEMYPWEHHFFEATLQALNTEPSAVPEEINLIIEHCVSETMDITIEEVQDEGEEFIENHL